jgi:hypothetical protein
MAWWRHPLCFFAVGGDAKATKLGGKNAVMTP